MSWLFGSVAAFFVAMTCIALFHLRWAQRLPSLKGFAPTLRVNGPNQNTLRCSVIVAARDEEARIENTLRHLLAQRGVEVEVIVVDDRSTDQTTEILRRLAAEDARVQLKRVEVLPDGWLGKCHACHVGASAATGDWILFTDADCWLKPDVIARALRVAERDGADHITLTPGIHGTPRVPPVENGIRSPLTEVPRTAPQDEPASLGALAWHLAFLTSLANWFSGVNRDRPKAYLGIGAFNLVRASAYRQCGGYEALRLTVVDDVKFGLLLRRAGKRTRAFIGGDDVQCHWGTTVRSMIKIMEKNYFAAIDFRLWVVLAGALFVLLVLCAVVVGPFTGTMTGLAAGLAPLTLMAPAGILARRLSWPLRSAVLTPFIYPVLWYAMLNSTVVALRHGGIRWRNTFYALEKLRAGTVR
jgi:glycosyltransferase involved in cell wall biosynthesis